MPTFTKPLLAPCLLLAVAAMVLPGCAGQRPGRVGITETTDAELAQEEIYPAALIEFSDQASRTLVQDLAGVPQIKDTAGKVTVLLGDLNNKTGNISSNEFELMRARLRNNLLNSDIARDKLVFVEDRARVRRLAERERVASDGQTADAPDYNPTTTYALDGDFYRIHRGNTNLYYLEMQLVQFSSNQIVWSNRYDVKQVN